MTRWFYLALVLAAAIVAIVPTNADVPPAHKTYTETIPGHKSPST